LKAANAKINQKLADAKKDGNIKIKAALTQGKASEKNAAIRS
jgi:hypothetical protein